MDGEADEYPPNGSDPIPDCESDWIWPAADTFTDESIARHALQTCSELGSQRIRLIKILPGGWSDKIECETKVCFLSEAGLYSALSYTWGSPVTRCHMIVDNQPRQIAANLWRFLRQARQLPQRFSAWLWIDALSIDQTDPWEKREQVKIIFNTFKSAELVVVWLGPAYGDSDKAMKALATAVPKSSARLSQSLYAPPLGPSIAGLCERAYWQRLWVFQELKCSQAVNLMCGARILNFERLTRFPFAENLDERVDIQIKDRLHKSSATDMVKLTRHDLSTSLWSMLNETSRLRCTDGRDKVYAILNTISSGHQGIEPDYAISLSTLINMVLRNTHEMRMPENLSVVLEQCNFLAEKFGVDTRLIYGFDMIRDGKQLNPLDCFKEMAIEYTRQLEELIPLTKNLHKWCKDHNHLDIAYRLHRSLVRFLTDLGVKPTGPTRYFDDYMSDDAKVAERSTPSTPEEVEEVVRLFVDFLGDEVLRPPPWVTNVEADRLSSMHPRTSSVYCLPELQAV